MPSSTPYIDISLKESYNLFYLGIEDISDYPNGWTVSNATATITPPGYNQISVGFTPKSVNYYKSNQLGLSCVEDGDQPEEVIALPDGVYTVKYSINPNSIYFVEKSFMRVNQIKCDFGNAFLKVDMSTDCSSDKKSKNKYILRDIQMLIEGSVAAVNDCDVEQAYKYYNKAKQMLTNFNKSGCNC